MMKLLAMGGEEGEHGQEVDGEEDGALDRKVSEPGEGDEESGDEGEDHAGRDLQHGNAASSQALANLALK